MYDWTNTYVDLEKSGVDTAVLMVGAIEQHGPHLPLSVDWFVGEAVARGVAERLNAYLLPGIPIGSSHAHKGFRGSVTFSHETLGAIVSDVSLDLLDQGFRRIAVINHHGGNLMPKLTTRDINLTQDKGKVVQLTPSIAAAKRLTEIFDTALEDEQHAGELETSLMLHLAPEQVGPQRIDHVPDFGAVHFDYRPMRDFCPDGIWGRASLASAEKGEKALAALIEDTAAHFEETFTLLGVPTKNRATGLAGPSA